MHNDQLSDWPCFYAAVKRLAAMEKPQRNAALEALGAPADKALAASAAMIVPATRAATSPTTTTIKNTGGRGA